LSTGSALAEGAPGLAALETDGDEAASTFRPPRARSCGAAGLGLTGGFAEPPAPRGATGADGWRIADAVPTAGVASPDEGLTPAVEDGEGGAACVSRRSCVETGARTDNLGAGFLFSTAVSAGASEGASITVAPAIGEGLALTAPEAEGAK
jgi:hypothetical protein